MRTIFERKQTFFQIFPNTEKLQCNSILVGGTHFSKNDLTIETITREITISKSFLLFMISNDEVTSLAKTEFSTQIIPFPVVFLSLRLEKSING